MKMKLFFLLLLGTGLFLIGDPIVTKVEASECYANCDMAAYYCEITAGNSFDACVNAASTQSQYSRSNPSFNGVPTSSQCSTWYSSDLDRCEDTREICTLDCGSGGSGGGGGGGGGIGKTPCDIGCRQTFMTCIGNHGDTCSQDYEDCTLAC